MSKIGEWIVKWQLKTTNLSWEVKNDKWVKLKNNVVSQPIQKMRLWENISIEKDQWKLTISKYT